MNNIQHQHVCGAVPRHMLRRIAARSGPEASGRALATLDLMRQVAATRTLRPEAVEETATIPQKNRRVYDAKHRRQTPGHLVRDEHSAPISDVDVNEAFDGSGEFYDFMLENYGRSSVDGRGKRLDSTVHYGVKFENAMWDGRQMIYGDGDGVIFRQFTDSPDIQGHEMTHGHIQYLCGLGYSGQTGALNEHIADVFGSLFKQWLRNETAAEADWIIGAGIFGPGVRARGLRSLAAPGSAYDDPILGKDPQPAHMRNYVNTQEDNGGVHINSGILNGVLPIRHDPRRVRVAVAGVHLVQDAQPPEGRRRLQRLRAPDDEGRGREVRRRRFRAEDARASVGSGRDLRAAERHEQRPVPAGRVSNDERKEK